MIIIFPDLPAVEVERVEEAEEITLILRTISPTALCPSCGAASSHIQSRYTRTLRDLPSIGHPIRLIMQYVVFSVKTTPALKKSLLSDFQISVIPMHNAQNGCNTLSVGLGSK